MVRSLTALLCVTAGVGLGTLWFEVANYFEPFMPVDFRYYFVLLMEIGAIYGFLSWFAAFLVQIGHVKLGGACCMLGVPSFFLFLLSGGNDLLTTLVAIALFTLAAVPSCVIAIRGQIKDESNHCWQINEGMRVESQPRLGNGNATRVFRT
jgi:hypothetical protein